jgi:hypothetical protein
LIFSQTKPSFQDIALKSTWFFEIRQLILCVFRPNELEKAHVFSEILMLVISRRNSNAGTLSLSKAMAQRQNKFARSSNSLQ